VKKKIQVGIMSFIALAVFAAAGRCASSQERILPQGTPLESLTAAEVNIPSIEEEAAAPPAVPHVSPKSDKNLKWYGADSRRARMKFASYMLYKIPGAYAGPATRILEDAGQFEKISELLHLQLRHMYGAFTTHPAFENNPGIPSGDYKVSFLSAEKVAGAPYAKVNYLYEDVAVFSKTLFTGGNRIRFVIPKDPVTIYRKGFPTPGSRKNHCTDEHYNSEDDFWYFWNPYQAGCPIQASDLVTIQTDLQPMNSTRDTYPEYRTLYGDNGNGDVLDVTFLVGVDENFRNGDIGKQTFRNAFAGLQAAGFKVTVDEPRRKRLSFHAAGARVFIDMHLVDPNTQEFARLAVHGLRNSDVFHYDGHSGLGAYLNPDRLADDTGRRLTLHADKYQIFYFQGCSTYAYYNSSFFRLKSTPANPRGNKNLDIVTTGVGAAFEVGSKVDVEFITSIATGQRPSWQTIINRIHAKESDLSSLTHVNGDEDNP
jgi:hypothetical protein